MGIETPRRASRPGEKRRDDPGRRPPGFILAQGEKGSKGKVMRRGGRTEERLPTGVSVPCFRRLRAAPFSVDGRPAVPYPGAGTNVFRGFTMDTQELIA